MNNKVKNMRLVTFKDNYFSKPALTIATKNKVEPEPIYIKGSTHAMHKNIAAKIKDKMGADVEVKEIPYEAMVATAKAKFEQSRKTAN